MLRVADRMVRGETSWLLRCRVLVVVWALWSTHCGVWSVDELKLRGCQHGLGQPRMPVETGVSLRGVLSIAG